MHVHIIRRGIVFCTLALLILLGLSPTAQAQMCGMYGIRLSVTNKSDKAIKKAQVRLIPEVKVRERTQEFRRDPKDARHFWFSVAEGTSIPGEYELLVGAPGFKTHRQTIKFDYCQTQHVNIKLLKGRDPRTANSQP